jgi:hypothetical protein
MSGPYVALPYTGGLPSFTCQEGFARGDFPALVSLCCGGDAATTDDAVRLRRLYGNGGQRKLEERLTALSVSRGMLVADGERWVAPVELFTAVILLAALRVYATSSPHAQQGKIDSKGVVEAISKAGIYSGGRNFGAIRPAFVDKGLQDRRAHYGAAHRIHLRRLPLSLRERVARRV